MMWKLDPLEHQSRAEGSSEPGLALGDNIQLSLNAEASPSGINTEMKKTGQVFAQPQTWSWAATDQNQQGDLKEEKRAQQPVRREMSWAGPEPGAEHWNSNSLGQRRERPVCLLSESELPLEEESGGAGSAPDWERSGEEWRVVKVKPVMITSTTPQAKETKSELPLEEESGGAGSAPDWERSGEEWRVVKVKPVMITSTTPQAKETIFLQDHTGDITVHCTKAMTFKPSEENTLAIFANNLLN
ncbi:UNVERIFIED_CONTAM: hypothetical protein FKN15_057047 [Acipenser sinensis]